MIPGHATAEATRAFAAGSGAHPSNFAEFAGLTLSNVGMGTYLGDADARTDRMVADAVKQSVAHGVNVIDTAINYRSQKAERSVGLALSEMVGRGDVSRDQVFVSTKGGYATNDADVPLNFWDYVREEYTDPGLIKEGQLSSGYHCMAPAFLSDQLDRSLKNLGLECVDLLYIHNAVEGQFKDVQPDRFMGMLESAFELYEQKRADGKIRFYGMATWECFRTADSADPRYLSLEDAVRTAARVGGRDHGFRFIQLPFNMYYDQALLRKNQRVGGPGSEPVSVLEAAARLGLGVFTSVPMMQGRLLQPGVLRDFGGLAKPSQRALQFIRSSPGVLAPLVGQKSPEHVSENLEIMKMPPMPEDEFSALVKEMLT